MFSIEQPPSTALRVFNTKSLDKDTTFFSFTSTGDALSNPLIPGSTTLLSFTSTGDPPSHPSIQGTAATDYFHNLYKNAKKTIQQQEKEHVGQEHQQSRISSPDLPKLHQKDGSSYVRSTSLSSNETTGSSHPSLSPARPQSPPTVVNVIGSSTNCLLALQSPPILPHHISPNKIEDTKLLNFMRSTSSLSGCGLSPRTDHPTPPESQGSTTNHNSSSIFTFNHNQQRSASLNSLHRPLESLQGSVGLDSLSRSLTSSTFHHKQKCLTGNCKYLFPSERCHVCRPDELLYQRAFYSSEFLLRQKEKWRRPRTVYTEKQLVSLEKAYKKNKYLRGEERKTLCKTLSLEERHIKVWYQNRRAKERGQIRHDKWLQRTKRQHLLMVQQQKLKQKQKAKQEKIKADTDSTSELVSVSP